MRDMPVCVTGATGYVGGRLVPELLQRGYTVRAVARSLRKLACRPWSAHPNLELVQADLLDPASVRAAVSGCRAVYYLVHSMNPASRDYAATDRAAARHMRFACDEAGVERIIYLGGMLPEARDGEGDDGGGPSRHLRSRAEVGEILAAGRARATILRAAQILGSGSASFEIIRYLCDRLPLMITPKWVSTQAQPIAISDVLAYLAGCLEVEETAGQTFDIAGPDVVSYRELFAIYREEAGLGPGLVLPVPVLTPLLSSYWIGLVTPLPAALARPLILGLKSRVVAGESRIRELIPFAPLSVRETIRKALDKVAQQAVETCWSDAGSLALPEWVACGDAEYAGGDILGLSYAMRVRTTPEELWRPIVAIGGETGWYAGNALWNLRGALDKLLGGVGLRRGRRHPSELRVGDALDFWRVVDVRENERLLLLAEMKVPGEALLEFRLSPAGESGGQPQTLVEERSRFLPRGLVGLVYWWLTYPFHVYIFRQMLRSIGARTKGDVTSGPERFDASKHAACGLRLPEPPGYPR